MRMTGFLLPYLVIFRSPKGDLENYQIRQEEHGHSHIGRLTCLLIHLQGSINFISAEDG